MVRQINVYIPDPTERLPIEPDVEVECVGCGDTISHQDAYIHDDGFLCESCEKKVEKIKDKIKALPYGLYEHFLRIMKAEADLYEL